MRSKNNHRTYKRINRKSIVRKNKRKSIVRKKQYGGTPPPPFYDILTVNNDDKSLLVIIYENLSMFIHALDDNNIPDERLEGSETRWVSDVKESNGKLLAYWKSVRLMECFKHSSFDYKNTINEIFLQIFLAKYDMDDKKYILQQNIESHKLPFIFNSRLGPQGKIGTPYLITHQSTKTDIIMKISNNIRLNIDVVCAPESNSTCLKCKQRQQNEKCFPNTQTIEYIVKSSEFINETIIGYVLNTIFFPKHISNDQYVYSSPEKQTPQPHELTNILNGELLEDELGNSVYQIGHFQSNDKYGSNIMERADAELDKLFDNKLTYFNKIKMEYNDKKYYGCIPEHKDIIITMLLLQLSNTLKIVADKLGMIHGDLKAGNVFFSIKPSYFTVNYPLNTSINIKTNIRLKIADYGKSSIIYKGVRFYCEKPSLETIARLANIDDTVLLEPNKDEYMVNNFIDSLMSSAVRHRECAYFRSIDLYCVIISLAMQSPIFMYFYKDKGISAALFSTGDPLAKPPNINQEELGSINTAFTILNKKQLKCGAIESCISKCNVDFIKLVSTTKNIDDIFLNYTNILTMIPSYEESNEYNDDNKIRTEFEKILLLLRELDNPEQINNHLAIINNVCKNINTVFEEKLKTVQQIRSINRDIIIEILRKIHNNVQTIV